MALNDVQHLRERLTNHSSTLGASHCCSLSSLLPPQVLTYSLKVVRLLITKGHSDVNERAEPAGLTPLLCAAMCSTGFDPVTTLITICISVHAQHMTACLVW